MAIELSPKIQAQINDYVEHGDYPDANALIDDALAALARQRQVEHLSALLQVGIDQADRGELIPLTRELREKMRQDARLRFEAGERAGPDVRP